MDSEPSPALVEQAARLIYERVGAVLLRVPFEDLDTERERQHHLIGSHLRHHFYDLAREILALREG